MGLHYLFSENKGADQLRGHRAADLRFCFCICKKQGSHEARSLYCHVLFGYSTVPLKLRHTVMYPKVVRGVEYRADTDQIKSGLPLFIQSKVSEN